MPGDSGFLGRMRGVDDFLPAVEDASGVGGMVGLRKGCCCGLMG